MNIFEILRTAARMVACGLTNDDLTPTLTRLVAERKLSVDDAIRIMLEVKYKEKKH